MMRQWKVKKKNGDEVGDNFIYTDLHTYRNFQFYFLDEW